MRRFLLISVLALAVASCGGSSPDNDPSRVGESRPLTKDDLDLLSSQTPTPDEVVESPAPLPVYYVPFGTFPAGELRRIEVFGETKLNVSVTILPAIPLSGSMMNSETGQVVGERMMAALKAHYPKQSGDYSAAVIGFTAADMRLDSNPQWGWAFGQRADGHLGVVSSARMTLGTKTGSTLFRARLRKMTGRYLGLLSLGMQFSGDPRSMLFVDLLGVDDLDRMQEHF